MNKTVHSEHKFRLVIKYSYFYLISSINDLWGFKLGRNHENNKTEHYDTTPVLVKRGLNFEKRKRSIDEINEKHKHEQYHSVYKRNASHHYYGNDYEIINSK